MLSPFQSLDLKVRNKPQTTPARLNRDAPLAAVGDRAVVRYQHQRGAQFLVQLEHQLHDGPASGEIQADIKLTSRLISVLHYLFTKCGFIERFNADTAWSQKSALKALLDANGC